MDSKWSESSSKFGNIDDQRSVKTQDPYPSYLYRGNSKMDQNNLGFQRMRSMDEESDTNILYHQIDTEGDEKNDRRCENEFRSVHDLAFLYQAP